jgi:nucleotide-binding universal stress UspA family protein
LTAPHGVVVVGYDGSAHARRALEEARRVARPGATVTVVYAHRVPPELQYYEFFQDVLTDLERGARETAESAREAFEGADLDVRYVAHRGRPGEVLAQVARERGADLIVMGSRGLARMQAAVGSAVLDVLNDAPCPVLVVPAGDRPDEPA